MSAHDRRQRMSAATFAACVALALAACASAAHAEDPFYKGKRITLMINFAPGGPTDIEGRLVAKHIAKHIDGEPSIVVQNKDGAGGLVGTNYMGEIAPKDGTMFAYLTRRPGARWSTRRSITSISRASSSSACSPATRCITCAPTCRPGMKQATDFMKEQGLVAAGLAADTRRICCCASRSTCSACRYRYITGYRSSNAARLAVQRGEASMHSESTPGYFAMVEPTMVKSWRGDPDLVRPGLQRRELPRAEGDGRLVGAAVPGVLPQASRAAAAVRHSLGHLSRQSCGRSVDAARGGDAARHAAGRGRGAAQSDRAR